MLSTARHLSSADMRVGHQGGEGQRGSLALLESSQGAQGQEGSWGDRGPGRDRQRRCMGPTRDIPARHHSRFLFESRSGLGELGHAPGLKVNPRKGRRLSSVQLLSRVQLFVTP